MTPDELRQKYLDFFSDSTRQHVVIPSASLIPENDPTTLFTSAGMQPLVPYLLGQKHPKGDRLVDSQRCFRAVDIEEVGDNSHTTFFEMLGNWSLGSYTKKDQLTWLWEFLTVQLKLSPEKLHVTVFEGDDFVAKDTEAIAIWRGLNVAENHIHEYGAKKNWWSRSGTPEQMPVGEPGGPSSEVFFDFGMELGFHEQSPWKNEKCHPNCDCGRFMEIGNSVFMSYRKTADGVEKLEQENIDFGGGLERMVAAVNNDPDIFKTDFFLEAIKSLENLRKDGGDYLSNPEPYRVIVDHLRAAIFMVGEDLKPSSQGRGYVLRRLLRRSMVEARKLGMLGDEWLSNAHPSLVSRYAKSYPELIERSPEIYGVLAKEVDKFRKTIDKGLKEFEKLQSLDGKVAFDLYQTYGFPLEVTLEVAKQKNLALSEDELRESFQKAKEEHSSQSRTASAGMFKGGLADQSETTVKYHTATHLLHAALRKILGPSVQQKGSNITAERLRFDFSFDRALTDDEKQQVETVMNEWIAADLPVHKKILPKEQALQAGAIAFFVEKYPDEVSVYTVGYDDKGDKAEFDLSKKTGWISKEFCGGPHVTRTGDIGPLKISKEKSASAGVRRIYVEFA